MTCDSIDSRLVRLEPVQLPIDLLARFRGQVERQDLVAQLLQVVPLVVLAELATDGLELLAEEHLPLPLPQLFLDLRLDVFLRVQHTDLPLDMYQHAPQPLLDAQRLEQDLPLRRGDVDISGDEIGELAGLVDAGQHLLDHFVGEAGFWPSSAARTRASR